MDPSPLIFWQRSLFCSHLGLKRHCKKTRRETIPEDDGRVGVRRIAGCLDTVVLPVCSAAPPRSQTRGCWGSVLTGRRSLCSTLPKPTACYPCREQSGIIWFGVSLIFFVRTAEQEHRHIVIFVPGEEKRCCNNNSSSSFLQVQVRGLMQRLQVCNLRTWVERVMAPRRSLCSPPPVP